MNVITEQSLRRQAGLFTIRELADRLGCPYRWFHHQLESGRLIRPSTRIVNKPRMYYTAFEVETVRAQIEALK